MSADPSAERWSVNLPAVVGVVVVFLVGVTIWVLSTSSDESSDAPAATTAAPATTIENVPPSTSPIPLPATTVPTSTTETPATTQPPSSTVAPSSTVVPTTAPGAEDGAIPGDLAVPGRPMQAPPCNDSYITVIASPIGAQATGASVGAVLDEYEGSNYLRADQTCPSLRPSVNGEPVYVIFFGPFAFDIDACTARQDGPPDAYARLLSETVGPDHGVSCA